MTAPRSDSRRARVSRAARVFLSCCILRTGHPPFVAASSNIFCAKISKADACLYVCTARRRFLPVKLREF